jgi:hypothetical protein
MEEFMSNPFEEKTVRTFSKKNIFALVVAGVFLAGCTGLPDGSVRDGCIEEKIEKNSYTEDFARTVCEGEYVMYGDDRPPIDEALDELNDSVEDFNDSVENLEDSFDCLESLNYSDPYGICD